jgi:hypothetical protein
MTNLKRLKKSFNLIVLITVSLTLNAQNWSETTKITASDRGNTDYFGREVAISGEYAIIGSPFKDDDKIGKNTGAVYIFKSESDGWEEMQKLVASDPAIDDNFGISVAINGDYAFVGAWQEDEDASGTNSQSNAGSVYVFKNVDGTWVETQKLVTSDRTAGDYFGVSIALNDSFAIIGAYREDHDALGENSLTESGSAYVFKNVDNSWIEVQKLVTADRGKEDWFGVNISISDDYIVISSYKEDEDEYGNNTLDLAGSAYIFKYSNGRFIQEAKLVSSDREEGDYFGSAVSISGDYAFIAAYQEEDDTNDQNAKTNAGSVYVFKNKNGNWEETQKIVATDRGSFDFFGWDVSVSGDYALIGQNPSFSSDRYVYAYRNINGTWSEMQKLVASDAGKFFGGSLFLEDKIAIIGASQDDKDADGENSISGAGSAYIFSLKSNTGNTEIKNTAKIEIYPNPVYNTLYIDCKDEAVQAITIYDLQGKAILKKYGLSDIFSVDISSLNRGVYILQIDLNERTSSYRLLKE